MAEVNLKPRNSVVDKVRVLLASLEAQGLDIDIAYIYGSEVVGHGRQDSDIDVAVVSADLTGDRFDDWMRLNRVASRIDVRMEVIGFRPEHFRDENPLAWEVKTKGIRVA